MPRYKITVRGGKTGYTESFTVFADSKEEAVKVLRKRLAYWRQHGTPDQRSAEIDSVISEK